MITVKVKTVKNTIEVFNTESYVIASKSAMHPDLLDVKVYVGAKCVKHVKRRFQWLYKRFLYKPLQTTLKAEE